MVNPLDRLDAGLTLAELLAAEPPPLELVLEIGRQGLRMIGQLHRHEVGHGTVTPDRLKLSRYGGGQLLVKWVGPGAAGDVERAQRSSGEDVPFEELRYSAPETFGESESADQRSGDLYAFGLVLYELLTGRFPIAGDSVSSVVAGHLYRPPLDFAESDPRERVPEGVRRAVLKALAKSPAERFADAESFAAALETRAEDLSKPEARHLPEGVEEEPTQILRSAESLAGDGVESQTQLMRPDESPSRGGAGALSPSPSTTATRILKPAEEGSVAEPAGGSAETVPPWQPDPGGESTTAIRAPAEEEGETPADAAGLEQTLRTIRTLREGGRAGEALKRLNRAVREFGPHQQLQNLRYELGEALLDRDAEEEDTARRMFEAQQDDPATTVISAPSSAAPAAGAPAAGTSTAATRAVAGTPVAGTPAAGAPIRSFSDATIRSRALPSAADRPAPPTAHPTRNMLVVAVVLVAVFGSLVYLLTREGGVAVAPVPEAQDVAASALSPGTLAIDAAPWAEIVHLENPAADEPPVISPSRFTPVVLSLPPGEYRVTLRCPPTGREEERVVKVESDLRADLRVNFEDLDAEQYFERMGW